MKQNFFSFYSSGEVKALKIIILKHIWHKTSFYLPKIFLRGEGKGWNLRGQVNMSLFSSIMLTDFIKLANSFNIIFYSLISLQSSPDGTQQRRDAINHSVSCPALFLSHFFVLFSAICHCGNSTDPFAKTVSCSSLVCLISWPKFQSLKKNEFQCILCTCSYK